MAAARERQRRRHRRRPRPASPLPRLLLLLLALRLAPAQPREPGPAAVRGSVRGPRVAGTPQGYAPTDAAAARALRSRGTVGGGRGVVGADRASSSTSATARRASLDYDPPSLSRRALLTPPWPTEGHATAPGAATAAAAAAAGWAFYAPDAAVATATATATATHTSANGGDATRVAVGSGGSVRRPDGAATTLSLVVSVGFDGDPGSASADDLAAAAHRTRVYLQDFLEREVAQLLRAMAVAVEGTLLAYSRDPPTVALELHLRGGGASDLELLAEGTPTMLDAAFAAPNVDRLLDSLGALASTNPLSSTTAVHHRLLGEMDKIRLVTPFWQSWTDLSGTKAAARIIDGASSQENQSGSASLTRSSSDLLHRSKTSTKRPKGSKISKGKGKGKGGGSKKGSKSKASSKSASVKTASPTMEPTSNNIRTEEPTIHGTADPTLSAPTSNSGTSFPTSGAIPTLRPTELAPTGTTEEPSIVSATPVEAPTLSSLSPTVSTTQPSSGMGTNEPSAPSPHVSPSAGPARTESPSAGSSTPVPSSSATMETASPSLPRSPSAGTSFPSIGSSPTLRPTGLTPTTAEPSLVSGGPVRTPTFSSPSPTIVSSSQPTSGAGTNSPTAPSSQVSQAPVTESPAAGSPTSLPSPITPSPSTEIVSGQPTPATAPSAPTMGPTTGPAAGPVAPSVQPQSSPTILPTRTERPSSGAATPVPSATATSVTSAPSLTNGPATLAPSSGFIIAPTSIPTSKPSASPLSASPAPSSAPSSAIPITTLSPTISPSAFPTNPVTLSPTPRSTGPVSSSPFTILYTVTGSPDQTSRDAATETTCEYLGQYMTDYFSLNVDVVLASVACDATLEAFADPAQIGYSFTATFDTSSPQLRQPTVSELDALVQIAFLPPSSNVLLEDLAALPADNPFSTTTAVSYQSAAAG